MLSHRTYLPSATAAAEREIKHAQQARALKIFWLIIGVAIGAISLLRLIRVVIRAFTALRRGGERDLRLQPGRVSWRRFPHALQSLYLNIAFRTTFHTVTGTVAEATCICGYIGTMLAIIFIGTSGLERALWEDRAGVLAATQFPFIVALAGKNNVISLLTGISHERLNIVHRAAARTCILCLGIHAVTHLSVGLSNSEADESWLRWGIATFAALALTLVLSLRPFRQAAFEFFLVSHVLLVAVILAGAYLHTRQFGYEVLLWPAFVLWALDRCLRFTRIFWHNRIWRGTKNNGYSNATAELLSPDTVRLTLRRPGMKWKAGQHAYIILPTVSRFPLEAHPFTISTISASLDSSVLDADRDLVFLIRGRNGFTGRLRDLVTRNGTMIIPTYIDGPYGSPPSLSTYSTCLLIAGGSGVSYALPLLLDIIRNVGDGKSSVRRVVFVWVVRNHGGVHISWLSTALSKALAISSTTLEIDIRVHLTGEMQEMLRGQSLVSPPALDYMGDQSPRSSPTSSDLSACEKEKEDNPSLVEVSVTTGSDVDNGRLKKFLGRPDIIQVIQDEIDIADGPVSIDVAGPSTLIRSIRSALKSTLSTPSNILRGAPSVSLHVETFGT